MTTDDIKRATQAGWDEMSKRYQSETQISVEDVHYAPLCPGERELKLLGDVSGISALELACGAAQNAVALAKMGATVTALDISPDQLRAARELVTSESVDVNLVRGDMERLGMFRGGSFDLVLSAFGWEYVPDLRACFAECYRVLRDGGLLVVSTVHPLAAFEWDEEEGGLIVTDYFNPPVELWGSSGGASGGRAVTIYRTVQELVDTFNSTGFVLERLLEPFPVSQSSDDTGHWEIPFAGRSWEMQYERFVRVPFAIVLTGRKR